MRACRAFRQLPLEPEQRVEIAVVPGGRRRRPRPLQPRGDRVHPLAGPEGVLPPQPHLLHRRPFGFDPDQRCIPGPMRLAERMPARNQRHGFIIVHRHPRKGLANVAGRRRRVRVAVRALRIDVDQPHLHRRQRVLQLAIPGIALVVQPRGLRPPIDVLLRLPHVRPATAKAEGLEPHVLHRDVARIDHQIGPRQLGAVFLLDRPQQTPRLVKVAVVRPRVQRRKALRPRAGAAPSIGGAIGARRVPRHPHEQRTIMPVIRRPPVLRRAHQRNQISLHRVKVKRPERLGIAERGAHRVRQRRVLVQDLQVQLIGPPVAVRPHRRHRIGPDPVHHRAFAAGWVVISVHGFLRFSGRRDPLQRS